MKKALVLQHVPYEGQGYIAEYMREHGVDFDLVRLWEPYAMPPVSRYSALIVMGGPLAAYDEFPSKKDVLAVMEAAVGRVPVLGICLGSQLLAHALGARVYPNERDGTPAKEIGYYTVGLTPDGAADPLFKGFDTAVRVFEWHGDAFDLPAGASLLATSPICHPQAFVHGNAYGLLFHLEFTPEMVDGLVERYRAWSHEHFDLDEARLLAEAREIAPLMRAQCYRLLDNFFRACSSPSPAAPSS